jgi:hypothetical protein
MFDPASVAEDATARGHLDESPIWEVMLAIRDRSATGRLSVSAPAGENHMFFMRGQPVGVQLADYAHPLGQLLLELGRIDAHTFILAQRLIADGSRLPGQVFKEMGVLDDASLREALAVQARRKAEEFCRLGSRPFTFGRGLTFLAGFNSTPLDIHAVLYVAIKQQMGPASRTAFLDGLRAQEVRSTQGAPAAPAPLETLGFGPSEERFLARLESGWQPVADLLETSTLPSDEAAVMLRFLLVAGRLQTRGVAGARPEPLEEVFASAPTPPPSRVRVHTESTDPRRAPPTGDIHDVPTDLGAAVPAPVEAPSIVVAPDLLEAKKKKRKKRDEPEPSVGRSALSETRREKTGNHPLPSIVVEDE